MVQTLEQTMRARVTAELERTVSRWEDQGKPQGRFLRAVPGDKADESVLVAWTWFGANLVYSGQLWQAAIGERLYRIALEAAEATELDHPGLALHKGIDLFMLGMAQLNQGRVEEGIHNILRAVEEDRAAGSPDDKIVARRKLDEHVLPKIREGLEPAVTLCQGSGHAYVTANAARQVVDEMCIDPANAQYRPIWSLWLYNALRRLQTPGGATLLTPVQRLEALQDLSFLYEAALKERFALGHCTLKAVVGEVVSRKPPIPAETVSPLWEQYTGFGLTSSTYPSVDCALKDLKQDNFGLTQPGRIFACQAVLAVGLIRNMAHHEMDLTCAVLGSEFQWSVERMLAAVLLSW